jgi:Beta-lactamase
MRWVLKSFRFLAAIPVLGILGLSGWLAFIRPDLLPLASAYAAKTVCSNVFIAKRDADTVIRTDVQFAEHRIVKLMKIDVDAANRRVEAALFGLFGKRYAAYAEGRGCTLVSKDEIPARAAAPPLLPLAAPDAFWPTGETAQLSDDRRLWAALNDPVLQGPGVRAIVVVHDGRIVGETYGAGFNASTPLLGWSMTKTVNAVLVGMAIKDGKLALDQKGLFPQWAGDARADISVADLMAMSSGLEFNEDQGLVNDAGRMEFFGERCGGFREG